MKALLHLLFLAVLTGLASGTEPFIRDPRTNDLKIAVIGSSTVWGSGLLDEKSMAEVDNAIAVSFGLH